MKKCRSEGDRAELLQAERAALTNGTAFLQPNHNFTTFASVSADVTLRASDARRGGDSNRAEAAGRHHSVINIPSQWGQCQ